MVIRVHGMSKPIHPPVAYVEWLDTASISSDWQDREEALREAGPRLEPCVAAGLLLADEERGVILALLYTTQNDHVGHVVVIPRSAILKMRVVLKGRGFKRDEDAPESKTVTHARALIQGTGYIVIREPQP